MLGLQRAELLVGEYFPELMPLLSATPSAFLLFPVEFAQTPQPLVHCPDDKPALLIVPDGTWRKARKIVQMNPILHTLTRLSLQAGEPSRYRVRKTRVSAAVSTIEAIERTLAVLEPEQDFLALLRPFEALVDQQIEAMGADVYQRYLSNHT